jgi:endonuclease YncB( thermonuclease family)
MNRRRFLTIVSAAACALIGCSARAQDACKLTPLGQTKVASVLDGGTLMLEDGRELRLAGIDVATGSRDALQALTGSQTLRLERLGPEQDRYGRVVAYAFPGDAPQSLQSRLLAQGFARVAARIGPKPCATALLTIEGAARLARRRIWVDPNFAPCTPRI